LLGYQPFLRMGCPSTLVCSRRNQSVSTRTFHGNGWQGKGKNRLLFRLGEWRDSL
jgi:hypothetical protein